MFLHKVSQELAKSGVIAFVVQTFFSNPWKYLQSSCEYFQGFTFRTWDLGLERKCYHSFAYNTSEAEAEFVLFGVESDWESWTVEK